MCERTFVDMLFRKTIEPNNRLLLFALYNRYRLILWLTWLKTKCGFTSEKFMIDCAVTEYEAIQSVYRGARIIHCLFHVGQLWEQHLKKTGKVNKNLVALFSCMHTG